MRQSFLRNQRFILTGILFSILAAATTYAIERSNAAAHSAAQTDRQLMGVEREFTRFSSVLRGAMVYLNGGQQGAAQLSSLLDTLDSGEPSRGAWLWARTLPRPLGPEDAAQLAALAGKTAFTLHDSKANSRFISPVIMALRGHGAARTGEDLAALPGLPSASTAADGSPSLFLLPMAPAQATPASSDPQLVLGAIATSQGTRPVSNILLRFISGRELAAHLGFDPDQTFSLNLTGKQATKLLGNATPIPSGPLRQRDFTWADTSLTALISPRHEPLRHWLWLSVLVMGLMLTTLLTTLRAGVLVGQRASTLGRELASTATELSKVRLMEEALFNNAGAAICETDYTTGRFLRVNERMGELIGYPPKELVGKTFADITHPDDLALTHAAIAAASDPTAPITQFEKRYVRRDGTPFWALVNTRVVRNAEGEPVAFATIIVDITERKLAEDMKASLLMELAHRVRNTVQLTASLARQTARNARSVKDYELKFQRRLGALKNTHDILFDSDWHSASLRALAQRVLAPFMAAHDDKPIITMEMPPVALPPQHAQTFAIALLELAANSATHGALAHGGTVAITGALEDNDGSTVLNFIWTEHSKSRVQRPRRQGFGSSILFSALPNQFGGTAEARWPKTGLVYQARLPLSGL